MVKVALDARVVVGILASLLLSGCFVKDTIRSEMSSYAEPADGPMAHIRLIGSRNVKVYPNSTCVSTEVLGSGYPAGPQMGGQRKRDLGMPKAVPMPRHFVEIAARADQPISAGFSFYAESTIPGVAGTGMPNSTRSASCYGARSFVPQVGQNYEVTAGWGNNCAVQVVQLVTDANGVVQRVPVPSQLANGCSVARGDAS